MALSLSGISAETPDPEGGIIFRDEAGRPEGYLADGAIALLIEKLPPLPNEELVRTYLAAQADLHALGITALTEPGLGPGYASLLDGSGSPAAMDVLGDLAESGELTMRVSVLALPNGTGGGNAHDVERHLKADLATTFSRRGIDPRRLRCEGVKVFADGTPQTGTSWHKEPVLDGGYCGHMALAGASDQDKVDALRAIVRVIEEAGLQVAVHSVGDKTNEVVIDALVEFAPNSPHRPYLIHGTELYNDDLEKMARFGIGWTANPSDIALWATTVSEARRRRMEPLGSALRAGVRPGITSDAPVMPPDWRPSVFHAVTRDSYWEGDAPEDDLQQRITTLDALALITREAAYRERDESWRGDLAVGLAADLVVLDAPWPDDEHVEDVLELGVTLTMVNGDVVYRR